MSPRDVSCDFKDEILGPLLYGDIQPGKRGVVMGKKKPKKRKAKTPRSRDY